MSEWDFSAVAESDPQPVEPRSRRERRQQQERRGGLFLFPGVLLGLVIGLVIALVWMPLRYVDARPDLKSGDRKSVV